MHPPISSDSEGDYDGFSFGDEFDEFQQQKRRSRINSSHLLTESSEDNWKEIKLAIAVGDVLGLKRQLLKRYGSEQNIVYDAYLSDGWTLMLHAVSNLQLNVVHFLSNNGADVNRDVDSITPLMLLCKQETYPNQANDVISMTNYLLKRGAIVNNRDRTGFTPLIYACISGNKDIVNLLLKKSAIDATDNFGDTALHHAVKKSHIEIARMLVEADADTEIYNSAGLTPSALASSLGLTDFEDLFPEEVIDDDIPASAEEYQTYRDLAPQAFPEYEVPAYSQDIRRILQGMRADICAKHVYKAKMSLSEFLLVDEMQLQSIGIEFEYQRKRILHGLLKFHGHEFLPKSLKLVSKSEYTNMNQYFEMYAGYLKHLILMRTTVIYLCKIGATRNIHEETTKHMLEYVKAIQKDVAALQKYVKHLSSFSTKHPLFIESSIEAKQKFKNICGPFFKCSMIIGVGLFITYAIVKAHHLLA
ncbi:Ankyrin repeat, SAM and basic leucine zipper domain-containing protein 1, partial [Pseudolycoriella hygida]